MAVLPLVDTQGIYVEDEVFTEKEIFKGVREKKDASGAIIGYIANYPIPPGFYIPKLNLAFLRKTYGTDVSKYPESFPEDKLSTVWIEGRTPAEIDELKNKPIPLTEAEILRRDMNQSFLDIWNYLEGQ